ncbi:MAG: fimbrillin family protein, partial [Muribaculaceae bacterium]|nr:fimbrillin family protein [Muribaculaceae bacterium]
MKKTVLFAAAALILTACDKNDENTILSSTAAQISATIGGSVTTRARDNAWSQGDSIGICSIIGGVKQKYVNVAYTTDGGASAKFSGDTPIYFYNKMALTAYYPFKGTEGTDPGIINASTDAANQTADKQPKIDFLYAQVDKVKVSNPEINF